MSRWVIAADVGSTTTKAACFERGSDGGLSLVGVEHAPTTVESPFENVCIGVDQAIRQLEATVGRPLNLADPDVTFVATSSAGGGLQMLACGTTQRFSASTAQRAAAGAGAIVLATLSPDDGLTITERPSSMPATRKATPLSPTLARMASKPDRLRHRRRDHRRLLAEGQRPEPDGFGQRRHELQRPQRP